MDIKNSLYYIFLVWLSYWCTVQQSASQYDVHYVFLYKKKYNFLVIIDSRSLGFLEYHYQIQWLIFVWFDVQGIYFNQSFDIYERKRKRKKYIKHNQMCIRASSGLYYQIWSFSFLNLPTLISPATVCLCLRYISLVICVKSKIEIIKPYANM